jgi:hypothetical protein
VAEELNKVCVLILMALREIPGVKWGLTIQRGPWKETPIDTARANMTLGKPNAGHGNAFYTTSPAYDPHYIPAPPGPSRYAQDTIVTPTFNQVGATGIVKASRSNLKAAIENHIAQGIATPAEIILKNQIDGIEENEAKAEINEDMLQNRFYAKEDAVEQEDVEVDARYLVEYIEKEEPVQGLIASNYIPPSENFYGETLDVVDKIPVFIPPRIGKRNFKDKTKYYLDKGYTLA